MVVRLWNTRTRIRNVQRRPQIRQLTETSATTLGAAAPLPPLSSRAQRFAAPGGAAGVWRTVNALAARPGMVNMGQGFPDFPGSAVARAAAHDALGKSAEISFASVFPTLLMHLPGGHQTTPPRTSILHSLATTCCARRWLPSTAAGIVLCWTPRRKSSCAPPARRHCAPLSCLFWTRATKSSSLSHFTRFCWGRSSSQALSRAW